MPKIIENIREIILEEAQKQLRANGYEKTTIRSIATACNIGVGTVYNHFPSKEALITAFMLEDWYRCTTTMEQLDVADFDGFFIGMNHALKEFAGKYDYLFQDPAVAAEFATAFSGRHRQLRKRLAQIIAPVLDKENPRYASEDFLASYVAESILYWAMTDAKIEDQLQVLHNLVA